MAVGARGLQKWTIGGPLGFRLWLHELGTQWGLLLLAGLFRVVAVTGVAFRFSVNDTLNGPVVPVLIAYFVFAVGLLVVLLGSRNSWASAGLLWLQIGVDVAAVSVLHYLTGDSQSDVYFLYLLPALVAAQYVNAAEAVLVMALIAAAHFTVLEATMRTFVVYPEEWHVKVFVPRQLLLVALTSMYLLRRWLAAAVAPEVTSPFELRETLERRLEKLAQDVSCDSASLQLLRENSSEIVACWGFSQPERVLGLAFPLDDPDFPNRFVLSGKGAYIVEDAAAKFPSFSRPQYRAAEIKSWLGVPLVAEWTGDKMGMIAIDGHTIGQFGDTEGKVALQHARELSGWLGHINLTTHAIMMEKELVAERQLIDSLVDVVRTLGEPESMSALATQVVRGATQAFGVEDCSLALYDAEEDALALVASSALPREMLTTLAEPLTMRPQMGLEAYSLATGQTLNLSADECRRHYAWNDMFSEREKHLRSHATKNVLITPVRGARGEPLGVLLAQNREASLGSQRFPYFAKRLFDVYAFWVGTALLQLERAHS